MEHTKKDSDLQCPKCNARFDTKAQLEEHGKQHHQGMEHEKAGKQQEHQKK